MALKEGVSVHHHGTARYRRLPQKLRKSLIKMFALPSRSERATSRLSTTPTSTSSPTPTPRRRRWRRLSLAQLRQPSQRRRLVVLKKLFQHRSRRNDRNGGKSWFSESPASLKKVSFLHPRYFWRQKFRGRKKFGLASFRPEIVVREEKRCVWLKTWSQKSFLKKLRSKSPEHSLISLP